MARWLVLLPLAVGLLLWLAVAPGPVAAQSTRPEPTAFAPEGPLGETCVSLAEDRLQSRLVDVSDFSFADYRSDGGHLWLKGTIRNNCPTAQLIGVAAIARAGAAPPGVPVAVSDTRLLRVAATSSSEFTLTLVGDLPGPSVWLTFRVDPLLADPPPRFVCLEVGVSRCLTLSPDLVGSAEELATVDAGARLLQAAAESGLSMHSGSATRFWADYDPAKRTISLGRNVDSLSLWERSAVIAHELHHALRFDSRAENPSTDRCLDYRADAFEVQGEVWRQLWQGQLPIPGTPLQRVLERAANGEWQDPTALLANLAPTFSPPCT